MSTFIVQIESLVYDWHMAVFALILYSFAWNRGQKNHKYWQKVYKRNEKYQKRRKLSRKRR